ncbi:MAG: hypothetical protein ACOYMN_06395 [Roseimicrobium sp.]
MKVRLHSQAHEWRSRDEDGTVHIIRAEWDSRTWHFQATTKKDPEWHDLASPSLHHYQELRDVLFRNRAPWKLIEGLDALIAELTTTP